VAEHLPNGGYARWTPPWLDALGLWLRLAGYDAQGHCLAAATRFVRLRPKETAHLHGTFIAVLRSRQRLYFFKDDRLTRMHIVSTARPGYYTPPMRLGSRYRGVPAGQVFAKQRYAWSRRYHCPMPYWLAITASGSHGIHAAAPAAHRHLGGPASHGCIRQHYKDAAVLFELVEVGTPVYVF
jgi:lipoprotein-anchoring transpeptidase ErfK/SrfK